MYPAYRPRPQPNYRLRRLVAATGAIIVLFLLYKIVGGVFGGGTSAEPVAAQASSTTSTPVVQMVAPPSCEAGDITAVYAQPNDWFRSQLDTNYGLPTDYDIPDLVSSGEANYADDFQIRSLMVEDLNRMRNAILEAGIPEVALLSAYRSAADQRDLVAQVGSPTAQSASIANDLTAKPGHSEHQLGTTIDVRPIGASTVDAEFGKTETGMWLAENSWRHGFILTHPEGKESVTCFEYDPAHLRYVGVELAGRVHDSGLTLREYLWHWEATGSEPGATSR